MQSTVALTRDNPKDWIEILQDYNTISECEEWWDRVNALTWIYDDARALRAFYFKKVALVAAKDWREKPIDRSMPKWVQNRAEISKSVRPNIQEVLKMFSPGARLIQPALPPCPF
jgi:hypothetical protein